MLSTGMLKVNRIKIGEVYILFIKKLTNYSDSMTRVNSQVCMHACVLGDHCADLVANCDTKLRQIFEASHRDLSYLINTHFTADTYM